MTHRVARHRGQAGATLVEVLVLIAVVVPAILAATYGMFTAVQTSSQAETEARLEALLSVTTEQLKSGAYIECATPEEYTKSLTAPEPTTSAEVLDVRYWSQKSASFTALDVCTEGASDPDEGPTPAGEGVDGGAQQLIVRVAIADQALVGVVVSRDADSMPASSPASTSPPPSAP